MQIEVNQLDNVPVAEVLSDNLVITSTEDGLDLLGSLYYQGFDKVILYQKNITPEFFNLRTGIAGEILQKFSNYRVRLAIVGDFENYGSQSFSDFMLESNRYGHVNFVKTKLEALDKLVTAGK